MLRSFEHKNATSVNEAAGVLESGKASLIAGGTDLLGTLKDNILPDYPETVLNIKTIPGLDYIKEEGGVLKIGALTKLVDVAENSTVKRKYTALSEAAKAVATPNIRNMGTIGGNVAQLPRCWYFRKSDNRFPCLRKGGTECFAAQGENRYHSVMGGKTVETNPCTANCPAGVDIPMYLSQIRAGDWDGAAKTFLKSHPLPMITSRICAHFCQQNCNRCGKDEAVQAGAVTERALGDYILANADKYYQPPKTETGKAVAVIGSGPAGLSAAFYLRKAGNKVTVFDTKPEPGGMLRYAIPAYRLPKDLVSKVTALLEGMGIEFKCNTKVGTDIEPEEIEAKFDSVLYATGAWKRPVMGFAGEDLTVFGLDFLVEVKNWMNGKVGQEVVVMGGGNVAMDVAVTAKRLGAKKVRLTCLEPRKKMPASEEEIARAIEEGIEIDPGWGLSRVVEENGKIVGLEVKRCLSPWDETGAFNPQYDDNDKKILQGENILLATGQGIDLSFLDEKYQLQLKRGRIGIDEDSNETSRPGVFAGGDVTTGPATVVGSFASGRKSAVGINRYLGVAVCPTVNATNESYITFDADGVKKPDGFKVKEIEAAKRTVDVEDTISPTNDEALTEAKRCLDCACYAVSPSDTAPALIALDAKIVTNHRVLSAEDLFSVEIPNNTVLGRDEIITEIQIPAPPAGSKSKFTKLALRKAIDFPVINLAVLVGTDKPRVVLNAIAPKPYRAYKAEEVLAGKQIDEAVATAVGEAAVADAQPLESTKYKVQIAKTLLKRTLLSLAE
ncbi:MAG: FAD binding domain-containing protein [Oscillospiraceae bacterium]|jgi:NADPH-dependent glutamate synthase beta subunit-like oxidoreductase|nr:FAD binding domain-containing protein [Oscillospiraceae bacterium]